MSRKKKKQLRYPKPISYKTAEQILAENTGYQKLRKLMLASIIACLLSISIGFILRINIPDLYVLSIFLNILGYLLIGVVFFIWFFRIRPLNKEAKARSQLLGEIADDELPDSMAASAAKVQSKAVAVGARSEQSEQAEQPAPAEQRPKKRRWQKNSPDSPEYLKYRRIWRLLLAAAAVMVLFAYFSLSAFTESSPIPLLLLVAAYLPIGGAIYYYNKKLKPLKQAWQQNGLSNSPKH